MDFNNIDFENFSKVQKTTPIDFEDFEEPQKTDWINFESPDKIILPDTAKKEKISGPKLGPIIKSAIQTTKKIFQSKLPKEDPRLYGIPEGAGEPVSTITGKPIPTPKEEFASGKAVMTLIPHAFAAFTRGMIPEALETAIMQPVTKALTGYDYVSPITEAQRVSGERLPKVAQEIIGVPAQMAGIVVPLSIVFKTADAALKTIGLSAKAMEGTPLLTQLSYNLIKGGTAGGIYGGIAEGTVKGMAKDAALFAVLEGVLGTATPVINKISKSGWYRKLSIKERGLVTEKIAKQYREGMTEADILRFLGKESEAYKAALVAREVIPKPVKKPKVVEPIITEPLKPTVKPTTELGRKLQAAIQAEKKPPVIADLAKRELEIEAEMPEAPMTTISEETTSLAVAGMRPEISRVAPAPIRAFGMRLKPTAEVAREPVGVEKLVKEVVPEKIEKAKVPEIEAKKPWEMTKEEFRINPPKGYYLKKLAKDDIAQAMPDGRIALDPENYFGQPKEIMREIIEHERAHFVEEKISPEFKAKLFDNEEVMAYRGRNINEKLTNMIQDGKLPAEVLAEYPDLKPLPPKPPEAKPPEAVREEIEGEVIPKLTPKEKFDIKAAVILKIKTTDDLMIAFREGKITRETGKTYSDFEKAEIEKEIATWPKRIKSIKQTKDVITVTTKEGGKEKFIVAQPPHVEGAEFLGYAKGKVGTGFFIKEELRKRLKKLASYDPEFKKNPVFTVKEKGTWLEAKYIVNGQKRSYSFFSHEISPHIKNLFDDGMLKEGDKIRLSKGYLENISPYIYLMKAKRPKISLSTQQKKDNVEFFSGFPIHKFPKAFKELAKLYDDHVGRPFWIYVSETKPVEVGKRFELIDRINKGIIPDYRKDPAFIEVRDDTLDNIQKSKEKIKELSEVIAKFSSAEQIRIAQIIKGGLTATSKRYEIAFEAIKKFQEIEKDLIELGILGEDNRFRQLSRKEIATKFKEIKTIDDKIKILQKKLRPIIKTSKVVRQVSEDISEEIISTTTDTTTGLYETKVTKFSELIEGRVKEALLQRGFAEGEATQMIVRLKESVIPIEGRKGTLKEIKETVKSVVTKTIIQEIERLKTYTPSMMARARGSIVRDINKEITKRGEILERIRLHYKMSGKLYLRRAYEKIESEKGFLSKLMGYVSKRPRLIKGYDIKRKDLSYLYRKKLGEIKRAPYLVYKGLSEETHDVFMMQMFNKVATNKDWTISPQQLAIINSGKNEKLIFKYKDFKPLPVTGKLGKLSGQLVDPYIWDDLNQAVHVTNDTIKAWDSVLRLWKTGKVVYNPATQCRNMLSNIILADWGGLPPHRIDIYAHAARDFLGKSGYWKEAKKTPLLGTEWAGAEIKQFLAETSGLEKGSFLAKSSTVIRSLLDKPGQMYQGIEQFFKLAVFINERKAGRTIKQAAAHAEKTIFNYLKIPPAIRWAKRWYSPFITFSFKAMPRFVETIIRKPWKIIKYGIMMFAVGEITRRMYGESKEEIEQEKKVLPDYMRKTILPGQISHLRIPYKDKYGRSKYLDLSFILPWGDIAEQWGQSHLVGRPFLPSHPFYISVAEVAFNEILFTGQELTAKDIDVGSEYWKKIGKQFWRQAVPSLAGSYSYNKLMAAYKGEVDWAMRDRSLTEAVFDTFFGLKVRSIDYTESRGRRLKYLRGRINIIKERFKKDYNKIIFDPTPDKDWNEKRIIRLYLKMDKQIDKILERIIEIEE